MDNQNDQFELLAILLVSHGSTGSHLLFKYPFADQTQFKNLKQSKTHNSLIFISLKKIFYYFFIIKANKKNQFSIIPNDNNNWIIEK